MTAICATSKTAWTTGAKVAPTKEDLARLPSKGLVEPDEEGWRASPKPDGGGIEPVGPGPPARRNRREQRNPLR